MADVIMTALALVAAVTFWVEYKTNSDINEAKFILELNNQFISNDQLKNVEWDLEKYYADYRNNKCAEERDALFRLKYSFNAPERQDLINYLVHLEGIATLICFHQLRLKQVSHLIAYRYFIAVNNPVVQELELLPDCYREHYQGIIKVYKNWEKHLSAEKIKIPMEKYSLKNALGK